MELQHLPLVSVLMTAFNRQNFIEEAIESVRSSTYSNFELIIVDDGSTDHTVSICNRYAEQDPRIKVYVNPVNLGDYPNRNKAASYAKGEFIFYVDSDDTIYANTIAEVVKAMELHPTVHFGMSADEDLNGRLLEPEAALRMHFFNRQYLYKGPGGTVIRRSFFNSINCYPEKYGPANDMYFSLKAACFSPVLLFGFDFGLYRRHEGQEINNRFSYLYNNYCYMRDALLELPIPFNEQEKKWLIKKNKRRFTFHLINFLRRTRDLDKTMIAYRKANFNWKFVLQGIFQLK